MSEENQKVEIAEPKANLAMTSRGFEPTTMEEAWRFSEALAGSDMVPDRYRGKPRDCLIVLDLSKRLNASWLSIMQHVYDVHGRIGMETTLVVSLVNQSSLFVDPIEYEVRGKVANDTDYAVRAFATRRSTGTVLFGPWIDWQLVKGEGWDAKAGSKWRTMPEQMFHYRAASWFQRRHCPEVTMGMLTTQEAAEIPRKRVASKTIDEDKSTVERILTNSKLVESTEPEKSQDHITDTSKKVDETDPEKPSRKPRSDKGKKRDAKPEQTKETASEQTQEPETGKEEPKLVKCPICGEEVDSAKPHDCSEPSDAPPTEPSEETPTTIGKDTHQCMRCERQFPKPPERKNKKGEIELMCPYCFGSITELT